MGHEFMSQMMVQAVATTPELGPMLCNWWNWAFWAGVVVGVIGFVVGLLRKSA